MLADFASLSLRLSVFLEGEFTYPHPLPQGPLAFQGGDPCLSAILAR